MGMKLSEGRGDTNTDGLGKKMFPGRKSVQARTTRGQGGVLVSSSCSSEEVETAFDRISGFFRIYRIINAYNQNCAGDGSSYAEASEN